MLTLLALLKQCLSLGRGQALGINVKVKMKYRLPHSCLDWECQHLTHFVILNLYNKQPLALSMVVHGTAVFPALQSPSPEILMLQF